MKVTIERRKTKKVLLDTVDKVKEFVKQTNKFLYDVQLISGRYTIDAKSILGCMSLDLSKPVILNMDERDEGLAELFLKKFYVR